MINVTSEAIIRLKELIVNKPEAVGVRIDVVTGGCSGFSYKFGYLLEKNPIEDILIEIDNLTLAIDQQSSHLIDNMTLDYVEENFSKKFVFNNPCAKSCCGCGKSFSV